MRVVVTDYIEPDLDWERHELARVGIELRAHQLKDASESDLISATRDADAIVVNMAPITDRVIASWSRCRLVIRHGIGYDNVDVVALQARSVPLVNVPDYCVEEVAEQAIALLFALARQVVASRIVLEQSSRLGRWTFDDVRPLRRIQNRTVGIVGFGRIGSKVHQKLRGFDFEFLVCDPYVASERARTAGIETVPLERLLRGSDFVTLHAPLTDETRHLIDARALSLMKPSAYLINTARGGLINQRDLCIALREGRIAGAGLDVFEQEPPDPDDPLFSLDSAVLTPHLAWCSIEAGWDIRRKIVRAVIDYQAGFPLANCVNEVRQEVS